MKSPTSDPNHSKAVDLRVVSTQDWLSDLELASRDTSRLLPAGMDEVFPPGECAVTECWESLFQKERFISKYA